MAAAAAAGQGEGSGAQVSAYTLDALRWMRRCGNDFEARPGDMERITYASVPMKLPKYREAVARRLELVPPIMVLGGPPQDSWPADTHVFKGHSRGVNSVAYSSDGRFVVTGSDDKTAKVWDVASGACVATLEGHSDGVSSVAYSSDGRFVVTGSYDNTAKVRDVLGAR